MTVRVWRPLDWQLKLGYRRSEDRCYAQVHLGKEGGVGFRQCANKPTCEVNGIPLCGTHAKIARKEGVVA